MLDWLREHQAVVYALTGGSVALFLASLIIIPAVIVRIPQDYFTHRRRPRGRWDHHGRFLRTSLLVLKNAVGYLLLIAGLAMLLLPGQGLLALLTGFFLLDLPGKYRAEKWLVSRPRILRAINWLRRRRNHPPLEAPGQRG